MKRLNGILQKIFAARIRDRVRRIYRERVYMMYLRDYYIPVLMKRKAHRILRDL